VTKQTKKSKGKKNSARKKMRKKQAMENAVRVKCGVRKTVMQAKGNW
jgi:hypothetical protein